MANIVANGRTPDAGSPTLTVEVSVRGDRVRAEEAECHSRNAGELFDDGVGFAGAVLHELPDDELAKAGRGLALTGAGLGELHYVREDTGNRWKLVLRREAGA